MAEENPPNPNPTDDKGTKVGDLRNMIREEMKSIIPELKGLFSGGDKPADPATPPAQQPTDVKSEVAKALEVLKTREARAQRDQKLDAMLEAHEKATKEGTPATPNAPKEARKVHKIMGWGE